MMKTNEKKPVSIHYDANGEVDGILLETIDESFVISLHDAEEGRVTWPEAMEKYGDVLPDKKQSLLICAYLDQINRLLVDFGGERLDEWYWTKAEYSANHAWLYHGYYGCVSNYNGYSSYAVRPVLASA